MLKWMRQRYEVHSRIINIVTSQMFEPARALQQVTDCLKRFPSTKGHTPIFADIALIHAGPSLVLHTASGSPEAVQRAREMVETISLPDAFARGEKIGMSGRAVHSKTAQIAQESRLHDDYISCVPETRSAIAVPIYLHETTPYALGAINVEYAEVNAFSDDDVNFLQDIAHLVAMELRKSQYHQTIEDIGHAILDAIAEDESAWIDHVLRLIVEKPVFYGGRDATVRAVFQRYDAECSQLIAESAFPPEDFEVLTSKFPNGIHDLGTALGTTGRAIKRRCRQYIPDVSVDPDYIEISPDSRSEADIILQDREGIVGVLSVKSNVKNGFDCHDINGLVFLSDIFVMALRAREYRSSQYTTRDEVARQTTRAWLGMANDIWRHQVASQAIHIRNEVQYLDMRVTRNRISLEELPAAVNKMAAVVSRIAERLVYVDTIPSLKHFETEDSLDLNTLVRERLGTLPTLLACEPLPVEVNKPSDEQDTRVRVSSHWLYYALDHLIMGAVKHMDDPNVPIEAQISADDDRIALELRGCRIPDLLVQRLRLKNKTLPDANQIQAVGELLLAQVVTESCNGTLEIRDSDDNLQSIYLTFPASRTQSRAMS
ncbi:MAG: hypothetical protein IAE80_19415 [Anaerolinea sp.]|nr:hypothetical protein [Anaerolinea sp.]